jgi:hypothetical protein
VIPTSLETQLIILHVSVALNSPSSSVDRRMRFAREFIFHSACRKKKHVDLSRKSYPLSSKSCHTFFHSLNIKGDWGCKVNYSTSNGPDRLCHRITNIISRVLVPQLSSNVRGGTPHDGVCLTKDTTALGKEKLDCELPPRGTAFTKIPLLGRDRPAASTYLSA